MRLIPSLPCLFALVATAAVAGTRADVEREIARVSSDRARMRGERQDLLTTAGALAERITRAKQAAATTRADPELTRELRDFDRLADRLDDVERRLTGLERDIRKLLGQFDEAADLEERALERRAQREGARAVSGDLAALAAARDGLADLRDSGGFRSALEISLDPLDGPAELDAKIGLMDGERQRISARLADLRREEVVLTTRLQARRQWARELSVARREAAGGVELLDQVHERTEATVRGLTTRVETLAGERAALQVADSRLAATRREAEERLSSLAPRREIR